MHCYFKVAVAFGGAWNDFPVISSAYIYKLSTDTRITTDP